MAGQEGENTEELENEGMIAVKKEVVNPKPLRRQEDWKNLTARAFASSCCSDFSDFSHVWLVYGVHLFSPHMVSTYFPVPPFPKYMIDVYI